VEKASAKGVTVMDLGKWAVEDIHNVKEKPTKLYGLDGNIEKLERDVRKIRMKLESEQKS